jgi:L-ribulose-5-phosphate 3-epimerase
MLGFMQGRLSPMIDGKIQAFPFDTWKDEFYLAKECQLTCVDWIVETERLSNNPFLTSNGLTEIRKCEDETGVKVVSICADYFMENPLIRCSASELNTRLNQLSQILDNSQAFGVDYIEIPCVDNSAMQTDQDIEELIGVVRRFTQECDLKNTQLVFETSLNPSKFQYFLKTINHPQIKANYDSGNSASWGFDVNAEFAAYGDQIATVHIKDRILGGTTVPLGEGNVCFEDFFKGLDALSYKGPRILQVARGEDNIKVIKDSMAFVQSYKSTLQAN